MLKRIVPGKHYEENCTFISNCLKLLFAVISGFWFFILILQSGDIELNPGPFSDADSSISRSSSPDSSLMSITALANHLSIVHYNVHSIVNKIDILSAELSEFDILAFSETWLNPSIKNDRLLIDSYGEPVRKDRQSDTHGGGVMIYIKDSIHYKRRPDLEPIGIECIWIEIVLRHKHILFGLFYRPPDSNFNYLATIENSIHLAVDSGIKDIIITGDFNFDMLKTPTAKKVYDLCAEYSLTQMINEPTHFDKNSSSLIDLLLVGNNNSVLLSGVGDPFLNQPIKYHCPVYGIFKFSKPKRQSFQRFVWRYEQGNYNLLRQKAASFNWNTLKHQDINVYAKALVDKILEFSKQSIPNKVVTIRPSEPTWMNSNIRKHIRKRKRAYRKAKRTNLQIDWVRFKHLRNETTSLIRDSKNALTDSLANKLKSDSLSSKQWWSLLKSFISPTSKSSCPPLVKDGLVYSDEKDKANILNDFFKDQTLLDDSNAEMPEVTPYPVHHNLDSIILTPDEVKNILKALPIGKATGPDGLSNRILAALANELSSPLCDFFNQSLYQGDVPDSFKESHVSPVPKGGDQSLPSNYRPISLLSNMEKCLERAVFKYLYSHFRDNDILTSCQSGFIPGDSTVNQLAFLYDTFCQAIDDEKEVRVVFCDVSKAFDRVWHAGLIHKLKAAGITGQLLDWFVSYLENRRQRVVISGVQSDWAYISAGVPQGSILGPLLFLLYINDIVNDIGCNIRLFADDTSLFVIVENPDSAAELINRHG